MMMVIGTSKQATSDVLISMTSPTRRPGSIQLGNGMQSLGFGHYGCVEPCYTTTGLPRTPLDRIRSYTQASPALVDLLAGVALERFSTESAVKRALESVTEISE